MNTMKKTLLFSLVVVGLALAAESARACTYACVEVGPGFCQRCQDVGYWTGGGCRDVGSCGCYDVQEICFASVSLSALAGEPMEFTALETGVSPAQPAAVPAASTHE